MPSSKSRKHPPSREELDQELLVLRSQLEADQIVMTRELLLRVVDCLSPSWLGSGVDLFAYYDREVDEETREKDRWNQTIAHMQTFEDWCNSWYRCARPEWLDVMGDILIQPPPRWMDEEEFALLFLNVAGQFPDKAVQVLAVLFSDQKVHPQLASLIKTLSAKWF